MKDPQTTLRIGEYALSKIIVPMGDKPPYQPEEVVLIENDSGEAMSTAEAKFAKHIHDYFVRNL